MSDQDPAVGFWRDAIEAQIAKATPSAALAAKRPVPLEEQLDRLRQDYNGELAARVAAERERDTLREVAQGNKRHVAALVTYVEEIERDRDAALAECERLRALVVRGPGRYHLTDKGVAATEVTDG